MNFRRSYAIKEASCWGAVALALFAYLTELRLLGILSLVIFILGVGQATFFYRCPHCGARLDLRARTPKFCPECGKQLKD